MSSLAARARYQSAVQSSARSMSSRGRQPSVRSASIEDSVNARASLGWAERSGSQPGLPPKRALNASTTAFTVEKDAASGPKLTARGARSGVRIAQADRPAGLERAHTVGNQSVDRPVAAADHVAGTRGRDGGPIREE